MCKNLHSGFQTMADHSVKDSVVVKKEFLLVIPDVCYRGSILTETQGCESR